MAIPTAKGYFAEKAIVPEIMARFAVADVQREKGVQLDPNDVHWFVEHVDTWIRWMHANKPVWRKKLEREENKDRDFILTFVRHWSEAFVQNPVRYKQQHPLEDLK